MNIRKLMFPRGVFSTANNAGDSWLTLLKTSLKELNVPYNDLCCNDSFNSDISDSVFTPLSSDNWDITAYPKITLNLTSARTLNIVNFISGKSVGIISVIGNGFSLIINNNSIPLNATGKTMVSAVHDGTGFIFNSNSSTGSVVSLNKLAAPVLSVPTVIGGAEIDNTWSNVATAISYELQRATDANFTQNVSSVYIGGALSYHDTTVTKLTTFYYRVRAIGDGSNTATSDWSTVQSATTGNAVLRIQDTFNRANINDISGQSTSDGNAIWVKGNGPGQTGIVSNMAKMSTSYADVYVNSISPDGELRAVVGATNGALAGGGTSLLLRYVNGSNAVYVDMRNGNIIQNLNGSVFLNLPSGAAQSIAGDLIKAVISGNTLTVYRNGVQINATSALDTSNVNSHMGFQIWNDPNFAIDQFEIWN